MANYIQINNRDNRNVSVIIEPCGETYKVSSSENIKIYFKSCIEEVIVNFGAGVIEVFIDNEKYDDVLTHSSFYDKAT